MRNPTEPVLAKCICGLLFSHEQAKHDVVQTLESWFGKIILASDVVEYTQSNYYDEEMQSTIWRQFIAFEPLIDRTQLPLIKRRTIELEKEIAMTYAVPTRRVVNVDPGYLVAEKMVLATTKNYSHRIYLQHGIYADLTLMVQKKRLTPLPWTYPDYATNLALDFFADVRSMYLDQLRN